MSGPPDGDGLVISGSHELTFRYRNYRGEVAVRRVGGCSFWYGVTEFHPEPQWFLHAMDLERPGTFRDFAMKDMTEVTYT